MSWNFFPPSLKASFLVAGVFLSSLAFAQDPVLEARLSDYREQVTAIMNRNAEWGGPRNKRMTGSLNAETADYQLLIRIALELGKLAPDRFKPNSKSFENLAMLFDTENPKLAQVLRTNRVSHAFRHRVKDWLGRHALNLRPELEIEPLKAEVLRLLAAYPPAGPASNASGQTLLDFRRLRDIAMTLGELDPDRFQRKTGSLLNIALLLESDHPDLAKAIRERVEARNIPKETLRKRQDVQTKLKGLSYAEQREETFRIFQSEILRIYDTYAEAGGPRGKSLNPDPELARLERADAKKLVVMGARLRQLAPSRFQGTGKENLARLIEDHPQNGKELAALIRTNKQTELFPLRLRHWLRVRSAEKFLECLK